MNYTIFPHKTPLLSESHVLGHVDVPYERLTELFKEPFAGDGASSDVEWNIQLENYHIISVYNYRNGKAYNGKEGLAPESITSWTVNGFYDQDFKEIQEFLEGRTSYDLTVHMKAKDKDNLIKRLRTIADHIEEGMTATENPSDYHSWELRRVKTPISEITPEEKPTYRL